jgi:hypothetical protein
MKLAHLPRALVLLPSRTASARWARWVRYQKVATSNTLAISQYDSWDTAVT